ncbi:hypothetical protein [Streptomyces sp. Ag109_G2-15]|uniref:hypothetical protein n=1 Tax=Streptomyces sp. Ag109_G2-15 TaxID=1938850 RepID=UPI00211CDB61|nr:hypothetical protein [Streptomyces sp. Ag109_G2-15]
MQPRPEDVQQPVARGGHDRTERVRHAREGALALDEALSVEAVRDGGFGHGLTVP